MVHAERTQKANMAALPSEGKANRDTVSSRSATGHSYIGKL